MRAQPGDRFLHQPRRSRHRVGGVAGLAAAGGRRHRRAGCVGLGSRRGLRGPHGRGAGVRGPAAGGVYRGLLRLRLRRRRAARRVRRAARGRGADRAGARRAGHPAPAVRPADCPGPDRAGRGHRSGPAAQPTGRAAPDWPAAVSSAGGSGAQRSAGICRPPADGVAGAAAESAVYRPRRHARRVAAAAARR